MKLRVISILTLILVLGALSACSSGPTPPEKGSPAWLWSAAKETFGSGDWVKSSEHLGKLTSGTSEFDEKARPMELLVLDLGLIVAPRQSGGVGGFEAMGASAPPSASPRLGGLIRQAFPKSEWWFWGLHSASVGRISPDYFLRP